MEIEKLFKDSFAYPSKDWNKLLIFGVLILIFGVVSVLGPLGFVINHINMEVFTGLNAIDGLLLFILPAVTLIILYLIISGYNLSITKNTINNLEDVPKLDLVKNIIDGIKLFILEIVYFAIPIIMVLFVAYVTGLLNYLYQLLSILFSRGALNPASYAISYASSYGFRAVFLVATAFFILFGILFIMAKAILAKTDSLAEASNIVNVCRKIDEIEWGNYIIWIILMVIILVLISTITSFIMVFPVIGIIITILVIIPYVNIFVARSLGLIYNESKE